MNFLFKNQKRVLLSLALLLSAQVYSADNSGPATNNPPPAQYQATTDQQVSDIPHRKKILILWSAGGHKSAAEAVREDFKARYPDAEIVFKDFAEIYPGAKRLFFQKAWGLMQRKSPKKTDEIFKKEMVMGRTHTKVSDEPVSLTDPDLIEAYIEDIKPDAVISTHYVLSKDIARLREQGRLAHVPVAWIHTDYVDESVFAQLAAELDKTFTGHDSIADGFVARGVDRSRVSGGGIPIKSASRAKPSPEEISQYKKTFSLDPAKKTIVIMGGSFGGLPYDKIVDGIVRSAGNQPIQIVAFCAQNEDQKKILDLLASRKGRLPSGQIIGDNIDLRAMGTVDSETLARYAHAADYIVTKPGGLSSTELMFQEKPVIFYDSVGGPETENAKFMQKKGTAVVAKTPEDVGHLIGEFESDPSLGSNMSLAQKLFQRQVRIESIADWAMSAPQPHSPLVMSTPISHVGDTVEAKVVPFDYCMMNIVARTINSPLIRPFHRIPDLLNF